MTAREQTLADALEAAYSHLEMDKLRISHGKDADIIDQAVMLAKFPAPEGGELPPLPVPYRIVQDADGFDVQVFRVFQMRDYARAALAAQHQATVALTEEVLLDGFCKARHSQHYASVFIAGARFAECAHGIPAPQTKELKA